MKRFVAIILLAMFPLSVLARPESWAFVQSVGGIVVEPPARDDQGWSLPIRANVSGLEAASVKPTTLNSALICERTLAKVEGSNVYLTIVSGLVRSNTSARCPPAVLGEISRGKYTVFYRGPDEQPVHIRDVSIGL